MLRLALRAALAVPAAVALAAAAGAGGSPEFNDETIFTADLAPRKLDVLHAGASLAKGVVVLTDLTFSSNDGAFVLRHAAGDWTFGAVTFLSTEALDVDATPFNSASNTNTVIFATGDDILLFAQPAASTALNQNTANYGDPLSGVEFGEAFLVDDATPMLIGATGFSVASRVGNGNGGFPGLDSVVSVANTSLIAIGDFGVPTAPSDFRDVAYQTGPSQVVVARVTGVIRGGPCDGGPGPGCQNPPGGVTLSNIQTINYAPAQIVDLAAGDFNGDGFDDIAVVLNDRTVRKHIYSSGTGLFALGQSIPVAFEPTALTAGDLDGDARDDLALAAADPARFTPLGDLPGGGFYSTAEAISGDGLTVVGISRASGEDQAFKWTQAGGMQGLGFLAGGVQRSRAFGVSTNGNVVGGIGWVSQESGQSQRAVRWVGAGAAENLGFLNNTSAGCPLCPESFGVAVSGDGAMITGSSRSLLHQGFFEGFRWTIAGMVGLGNAGGAGPFSFARAVGSSGVIASAAIVGDTSSPSGARSFRWTNSGGMTLIPALVGATFTEARAVSPSGLRVVGRSGSASGPQAYVWTVGDANATALGWLPGGADSSAIDLSSAAALADTVIVGKSATASGDRAFVWTQTSGMRSLADVLIERGAVGLEGWTLTEARGVSDDGLHIVGVGVNPDGQTEGWLADLPGFGSIAPRGSALPTGVATVIFSAADGAASSRANYPTGAEPTDVAIADFDGDGRADVITANHAGGASGSITTLFQIAPPCPSDITADGLVNSADLAFLLAAWGPQTGSLSDLNDDGFVNSVDLAFLLGAWGACP